jgi:hypothetical protein
LVAKDTLKELLAEALDVRGRPDSQRLGAAVFELMAVVVPDLLAHGVSLIAEGNFTARWRGFEELPPCRVVQVHVAASPDVLRSRLRDRAARHPVHYDREAADEIAARAAAGEWDALPLPGELVRVDTTSATVSDTLEGIRHQVGGFRAPPTR